MSRPADVTDVYLHIGPPGPDTAYVQRCLRSSQVDLAEAGVLVPDAAIDSEALSLRELLGRGRNVSDVAAAPGAWQAVADEVKAFAGREAVVSLGALVATKPRDVRRLVRDLAPATVHVVMTVRDLVSAMGSLWQQELAAGSSSSWGEYVQAVHKSQEGTATSGTAFWRRHDPIKVLDRWESGVERSNIHLVTVPPPGASPELLRERFAAAIGLPTETLIGELSEADLGVGAVEAEVLHRLNARLQGLTEPQYLHTVHPAVRVGSAQYKGRLALALPPEDAGWTQEWARELVKTLEERGYPVVGELEDLVPRESFGSAPAGEAVSDSEVSAATMRALVSVTEEYAAFWWRARRRDRETGAAAATRLASQLRAASFNVRLRALDLADRNRLVAKAANLYLRRGIKK